MKQIFLQISSLFYRVFLQRIFFLFDSEKIHDFLTNFGEYIGKNKTQKKILGFLFQINNPILSQKINGVLFKNPVGLSAGFDYQAKLTQILPFLGFGFGTIGTITNQPYKGNSYPRLGRLIKSKSLLVNKGFKNDGIKQTLKKLINYKFEIPIGISIGQTNKKELSQLQAIKDIILSFQETEKSKVTFGYYELNISCPNLYGNVNFYNPKKLNELLKKVTDLKLLKPLFIKMPIDKTDKEILAMLDIITKFNVTGVIFGNLLKDRKDKSLDPEELKKYPIGNFSGKPTEKRSNELIKLTYKKYKKKLVIVGCGGIFSAIDAYTKIRLGATLIEMITGLIFEGPQVVAQINLGLVKLLKKDGFSHISDAIGVDAR